MLLGMEVDEMDGGDRFVDALQKCEAKQEEETCATSRAWCEVCVCPVVCRFPAVRLREEDTCD